MGDPINTQVLKRITPQAGSVNLSRATLPNNPSLSRAALPDAERIRFQRICSSISEDNSAVRSVPICVYTQMGECFKELMQTNLRVSEEAVNGAEKNLEYSRHHGILGFRGSTIKMDKKNLEEKKARYEKVKKDYLEVKKHITNAEEKEKIANQIPSSPTKGVYLADARKEFECAMEICRPYIEAQGYGTLTYTANYTSANNSIGNAVKTFDCIEKVYPIVDVGFVAGVSVLGTLRSKNTPLVGTTLGLYAGTTRSIGRALGNTIFLDAPIQDGWYLIKSEFTENLAVSSSSEVMTTSFARSGELFQVGVDKFATSSLANSGRLKGVSEVLLKAKDSKFVVLPISGAGSRATSAAYEYSISGENAPWSWEKFFASAERGAAFACLNAGTLQCGRLTNIALKPVLVGGEKYTAAHYAMAFDNAASSKREDDKPVTAP